jgi:CheY-like chemotaxis protein
MDVHKDAVVIAVLNNSSNLVMESMSKPKPAAFCSLSAGCGASCIVTWEEGAWGGLAVRSVATPGGASFSVRSASYRKNQASAVRMMEQQAHFQDSVVSSNDNRRQVSTVSVLVVDNFEPFRRWISSTLRNRPDVQIIAEASDGLKAVQMAWQFQPDVVLLDIGLPKLSGIDAARQIRKLAPKARIVFVSQEFSPEVAKEAFRTGAVAYVVKIYAGTDLPAAIDAALEGKQFRSAVVSGKRRVSRG